jgi:predicted DNA-binding transcriptional regulator AlpA
MALWQIYGPDQEWLEMADIMKMLGGISEGMVRQMVRDGRFPRPIRAGKQTPPRWHASAIASWQHQQPMLVEGEFDEDEKDKPAKPK